MKVITLAKTFPVYHPRAGEPTGFADAFLSGQKIHTIRANEKGYYKPGDIVSVRQWSGKPYASKQETLQDGVRIGVVPVEIFLDSRGINVFVDGKMQYPTIVALNDGLSTIDFYHWFNPRMLPNLTLNDSLIYFTDFRYQ